MSRSTAPKPTLTPKVGWSMAHVLMKTYLEKQLNTLWTGMPGIGKTALVKHVAKELKYELVIFHPVISDPTDFKGLPWCFTDKDGKAHAVFIPFDQLDALINATKPTICFLDDLGQAPEAVQAACMQLLHGGSLAGKKISKHVRFIAATNRKQDRAGVAGVLEPVKSRFHGIWELVPELNPFLQHMINVGMNPILVAFIRSRPTWLTGGDDGWKPAADIVNQACPRTIEHLSDAVNLNLDKSVKPSAYAGAVGQGMANEFFSFEMLALRLPDIDVILNNPLGAPEMPNQETAYACIGALHSRMDRSNIQNIYTYIQRCFSKEMQAVFHYDVESYNPALMKSQAYVEWSRQNGDVLTN